MKKNVFFSWAEDFLRQLQTNQITSVTKAKDIASTLWRTHSDKYDKKRAVQTKADHPGTGQHVKRIRQDDETQFQYRKRMATEKEREQENGI